MKFIAISILYALIVSSCSKVEINCEVLEMKNIKTSKGVFCASKELEENAISLLAKNVNSRTNEFILIMSVERNNEVKVQTSKERKLSFGHGNLYLFKNINGQWESSGEGTWVAD